VNKDLKKRLSELKKPAPAKTTLHAINPKARTSREQAGEVPTDVARATPKAALAEHEGGSKQAQNSPRKVDGEGGETIGEIVADLATRAQFQDLTADDLWPHLMGELDKRHLRPAEKSDRADIAKSSVSYFPPKKPKGYSITLERFRKIVSDARKKSQ
jgi:hypothetical protein